MYQGQPQGTSQTEPAHDGLSLRTKIASANVLLVVILSIALVAIFVWIIRDEVDPTIDRAVIAIILFALLGCGIAGFLAIVIARSITRPLRALDEAALDFAKGDLSRRAAVGGGGEVERLASTFNQMADAVERKTRELELALDAIRTVSGVGDLDAALHELASLLARAVNVPICRVVLLTDGDRNLVVRASYSTLRPGRSPYLGVPFPVDQVSPARQVIEGKQVIEIESQDSELLSLEERERWKATGLQVALGVPLMARDKVIGLLTLGDVRPRHFGEDERRLCLAVAQQASVAIERADLYQQLCEDRDRLDAIVKNTSDGIVLLDAERRVISMNPAMEALSGWTTEEVLGRPCSEIFRSRDQSGKSICDTNCPLLKAMTLGDAVPYAEVTITTKEGKTRDLSVSYARLHLPSSGAGYGLAISRDITKVKEAEKLKDEFASLLSHDLRQPVAAIHGNAQVLRRRLLREKWPQDVAENVEAIVAGARQLNQMIADLVDTTRLESGRLEPCRHPVSLPELVSSVIRAQMQPELRGRVRVEVAGDLPAVKVDPERLERVLANLLGNALKYSPQDGEVLVGLRAEGNEAVISVADRGIGVPAEDLCRVFDRFYRAKTGFKADGLGLGLYIARLLVEAHGGRIWAESEGHGKGSVFYVALPLT